MVMCVVMTMTVHMRVCTVPSSPMPAAVCATFWLKGRHQLGYHEVHGAQHVGQYRVGLYLQVV